MTWKRDNETSMSMTLPYYPPLPVAPQSVSQATVDLCGAWAYQQPVLDRFARQPLDTDCVLDVPGEVVMQGLAYDPATGIALERVVTIPADWAGHAIRVRFEAVYSACAVWIDGRPVAQHMGGFTPFDIDITALAKPGTTLRLTLHVDNSSVADLLAFGTRYADHPLIGIPRKAFLYALPATHILGLGVSTLFRDNDYSRAVLRLEMDVSQSSDLDVSLIDPDGKETSLGKSPVSARDVVEFEVAGPRLWDTETPSLYTLKLGFGGALYERKIGFREFTVKDRRPHLNGQPILLRGVNHHETHPTTGRADTARWAETDVRLFRDANVNLLRTSHYPPTIELAEACDAAGMLLEVEAPVCFAFGQFSYMPEWDKLSKQQQDAMSDYVEAASLEMVAFYRSHPSVVIWSVANESHWAPPFARSSRAIRDADPNRVQTFNWWRLGEGCEDHVEIANHHYPNSGKVHAFADNSRPILFDEFAHLYCYNDRELATDPGLRHLWGGFLARQWEEIVALPNGAGGSIWAAVDDWFAVPQPGGGIEWHGYGEWGPIDGWRRLKPEYEDMKRAFDPLRVTMSEGETGDAIDAEIGNRFDFADLKEVEIEWRLGERSGGETIAGAPGSSASVQLPAPAPGECLELAARLPRLRYERVFRHSGAAATGAAVDAPVIPFAEERAKLTVGEWVIGPGADGLMFTHGEALDGSISLALVPRQPSRGQGVRNAKDDVPLDNAAGAWAVERIAVEDGRGIMSGRYDAAIGTFEFTGREDGSLVLSYEFVLSEKFKPLQFGVEIVSDKALGVLEWQSAEPCDLAATNPARGTGRALAWRDREAGADKTRSEQPDWPWAHDQTAFGTNDFCSTKRDVQRASLLDERGRGIAVRQPDGMHVRAQSRAEATHLLVLDFSGPGSEHFLSSFEEPVILKPGDRISGCVILEAANQPEDGG